jgi:hypothetical protein
VCVLCSPWTGICDKKLSNSETCLILWCSTVVVSSDVAKEVGVEFIFLVEDSAVQTMQNSEHFSILIGQEETAEWYQ